MTDTSWRSLSTWTQLCLKPLTFHLEGHAQGRLKRPGHNHILRIAHLMSDDSKLAKLLDTNFPSPLPILRFLFLFYHIGLYIKKKKKNLVLLSNLIVGSFVFPLFLYHKGPTWSPCKQSALEKYLLIYDVHLVNFPQGRYSEIPFENSYIRFYH